uniref:AlNc14C145G7373 protein n=1 Tax=Albugo laibachii Nc14 TaxID=890382 RepID=F0WLI6_9STRA|nr:AlNc14C145G7373 [Albugo laibachii Nc14]|eukprot:CCA22149.1 AlNc14C145G7373 [Albugo laibachii Nc14]
MPEDIRLTLGPTPTSPFDSRGQSGNIANTKSKAHLPHSTLARKDWLALDVGPANSQQMEASVMRNLLVVYWKYNPVKCIQCLARNGELLLFSTLRSYAWLIHGSKSVQSWQCEICGHLRIGNRMELNIYPLRPISYKRISKMLIPGEIEVGFSNEHASLDLALNSGMGVKRQKTMRRMNEQR